jgi:ATP-dependent DNA helicase RecQ
LQEFGRAGRDGRTSIAVLFTGEKDEALLQFMAEKTAAMSTVDPESKGIALQARLQAIRDMRRMATSTGACVRQTIVIYFGEAAAARHKSLAMRIIEWLLQHSVRTRRTNFCCDWCDRVRVNDVYGVSEWASRVFAEEG